MADDATILRCPAGRAGNRVRPTASGTPRCAKCHQALPWVVNGTESTFTAEVDATVPVLVDFWAPWCGPCRTVSPIIERVAASEAGRFKVVKVNVDENQSLAARYGVQGIPALVLFRGGSEVARQVGALPEPQLRAWLAPHL